MAFTNRKQTDTDAETGTTMNVLGQPAQQAQSQQQAPQPIQSSGQSATIEGQAATPAATETKAPAASGSFTNIRKFLQANRGAGTDIANKAVEAAKKDVESVDTNVIQAQKTKEAQAIGDVQGMIQTAQQQGLATLQPYATKNVLKQYKVTAPVAGTAAFATPEEFASAVTQAKNKEFSSQYAGPDWSATQAEVDRLKNLSQKAQETTGRFDLLNQFFNKNPNQRYTQGMGLLDQAAIQQTPEARTRIAEGVKSLVEGPDTGIINKYTAAQQAIADQQTALGTAEQNLAKNLSGIAAGSQKEIEDKIKADAIAKLNERNALIDRYNAAIADDKISEKELSEADRLALGLPSLNAPTSGLKSSDIKTQKDFENYLKAIAADQARYGMAGAVDLATSLPGLEKVDTTKDLELQYKNAFATDAQNKALQALAKLQGAAESTFLDRNAEYGTGLASSALDTTTYNTNLQQAIRNKLTDLGMTDNFFEKTPTRGNITNSKVADTFSKIWDKEKGGLSPSGKTINQALLSRGVPVALAEKLSNSINQVGYMDPKAAKEVNKYIPGLYTILKADNENEVRAVTNPDIVWDLTAERAQKEVQQNAFARLQQYLMDLRRG